MQHFQCFSTSIYAEKRVSAYSTQCSYHDNAVELSKTEGKIAQFNLQATFFTFFRII